MKILKELKRVSRLLISIEDVMMGRLNFNDLPVDHQENVLTLVERINEFFHGYEWPLQKKVNDGYRRPQDTPKNGSLLSNHLTGSAVDLDDDAQGTVWKYVFKNRARLIEIGLWLEHPCWTHCDGMSWLHFQIVSPRSGKRFFIPSTRPNPNPSFWNGII